MLPGITDACVPPDEYATFVPVGERSPEAWAATWPMTTPDELARIVEASFLKTHDGWSVDEVVIHDRRNARFLAACRAAAPDADPAACNWALLNLRKAGKIRARVTQRSEPPPSPQSRHAAEIAARLMEDRYGKTLDRVMCDPRLRSEFDRTAVAMVPEGEEITAYALRKTALNLRKVRRLRPELVLRVADWGRRVVSATVTHWRDHLDAVPAGPGIYIFRDPTGYLYIGESANLRQRLAEHLDTSDRHTLATYLADHGDRAVAIELHCFDPASSARLVSHRRAYESELIRSRQPRFNLRP